MISMTFESNVVRSPPLDKTKTTRSDSKSLNDLLATTDGEHKLNKEKDGNKVAKVEKKVKLKSVENIQLINGKLGGAGGGVEDENKSSNSSTTIISNSVSINNKNEKNRKSCCLKLKTSWFSYSYIVLIASFISFMLASVLSCCFGVFFESMETDLGWSKSRVAFIGGFMSALQDLCGPVASALTNRFGCRKTCMFGGLVAGFGLIAGAYVSHFWLFAFLIGGVSGFGSSLVLVSSVVVVTYYFEEKPSFASGVTISGSSLGQSIFSIIIIKLNEMYGRSGCFLILGGLLLNIVVCGALFRPLKWELEDDDDSDEDSEDEDEDDDEDENDEDEEESEELKENPKFLHYNQTTNYQDEIAKTKRQLSSVVQALNENDSSSFVLSSGKLNENNFKKARLASSEFLEKNDAINENSDEPSFINELTQLTNAQILSLTLDDTNQMNEEFNNSSTFEINDENNNEPSKTNQNKEFSSDSCLLNKSSRKEISQLDRSCSLNTNISNEIRDGSNNNMNKNLNGLNLDLKHKKNKANKNRLFTLTESNLTLNKCHSLKLINKLNISTTSIVSSSMIVSPQYQKMMKSFYSSPNCYYLNETNVGNDEGKEGAYDDDGKDNRHLDENNNDMLINGQDEEEEDNKQNINDFVIVDANEIVGYDESNLIISGSQNAIYFPLLSNDEDELYNVQNQNSFSNDNILSDSNNTANNEYNNEETFEQEQKTLQEQMTSGEAEILNEMQHMSDDEKQTEIDAFLKASSSSNSKAINKINSTNSVRHSDLNLTTKKVSKNKSHHSVNMSTNLTVENDSQANEIKDGSSTKNVNKNSTDQHQQVISNQINTADQKQAKSTFLTFFKEKLSFLGRSKNEKDSQQTFILMKTDGGNANQRVNNHQSKKSNTLINRQFSEPTNIISNFANLNSTNDAILNATNLKQEPQPTIGDTSVFLNLNQQNNSETQQELPILHHNHQLTHLNHHHHHGHHKQQMLIPSATNNKQHVQSSAHNNQLIQLNNRNGRYLITRCNCKQRPVKKQQFLVSSSSQSDVKGSGIVGSTKKLIVNDLQAIDVPNTSMNAPASNNNININNAAQSTNTDQVLPSSPVTITTSVATTTNTNVNNLIVNNNNLTKAVARHCPTCPLFYLQNINNNLNNLNMLNHRHKANIHYVPNFFQNSYRVPMHFRNVYYYKSLVNLNMRLMTVKPNKTFVYKHRNIASNNKAANANLANINMNSNGSNNSNNVSLSCPDLQLKELQSKYQNLNNLLIRNSKFNNQATGANRNANNGNNTFIKIPRQSNQIQLIKIRDLHTQTPKYYILVRPKKLNNKANLNSLSASSHHQTNFSNLRNFNKTNLQGNSNPAVVSKQFNSNLNKFEAANLNKIKLNSTSKILNAGSIVFKPVKQNNNALINKRRESLSINQTKKSNNIGVDAGSVANKNSSDLDANTLNKMRILAFDYKKLKKSENDEDHLDEFSLDHYNDDILLDDKKKSEAKKQVALKTSEEDEDDDEDDEDEDDEDDDDDDDDDESDDEDCDNCFTKTKYGNYIYKYVYKPIVKPLKFLYYSLADNVKLFKLFKFCIFALCNFILSFFYESPFYFINSYMTENGSTSSQAGTVTAAVGIFSVFSSVAYGYIGDSKRVNSIVLYSISLVLCGLCCCIVPFFITNYFITMTLLVLIGSFISVNDVLVPIICVNIVGYDDFVNAYGFMFFCQGLASFSGPPILGFIVDKSESYALSYYIIGIGICFSGFILTSILCYDKIKKRKKVKLDYLKLSKDSKSSDIKQQMAI